MADQRNEEENQEDVKQDLRNSRRCQSDSGEAKHGCNERHDKKNQCPTKHHGLLTFSLRFLAQKSPVLLVVFFGKDAAILIRL
jgi:hypothetical protein